ncbi:hypothetical protein GPALN_002128 [Globodera pallida]|nr:hypothetical protein GPALN_002128 [Globodera pallida]
MANENDQIIRPSFPNQQNLPNQRGEEELDAYNLQLLSAIEACWLEIPEMRPNIKRMKAIVFANLKSSGSGSLVDQMIKMMEDVVFYEWQQHISEILLKMRTFVSNFKLAQRPEESLMVRIGFHSVAVAAGVVGLQALVNAYSVKLSISLHAWNRRGFQTKFMCNCTCPTAKDGPKNEAAVCLVFNAESSDFSAEVDNDTSIFNLNALEFLVNNIPDASSRQSGHLSNPMEENGSWYIQHKYVWVNLPCDDKPPPANVVKEWIKKYGLHRIVQCCCCELIVRPKWFAAKQAGIMTLEQQSTKPAMLIWHGPSFLTTEDVQAQQLITITKRFQAGNRLQPLPFPMQAK